MTLYFRNPEYLAHAQRSMMRKLLENTYNSGRTLTFPMEMKASQDEFVLTALLPGLTEDMVNVQFNSGVLSIEGEYPQVREDNMDTLLSEMPVGRFNRSIKINEHVVAEKIEASMQDGVLKIRLPKAEEAKPKSIKINTR